VGRLDLARREVLEWKEEWFGFEELGTSCLQPDMLVSPMRKQGKGMARMSLEAGD